jgi:hypothetical protein
VALAMSEAIGEPAPGPGLRASSAACRGRSRHRLMSRPRAPVPGGGADRRSLGLPRSSPASRRCRCARPRPDVVHPPDRLQGDRSSPGDQHEALDPACRPEELAVAAARPRPVGDHGPASVDVDLQAHPSRTRMPAFDARSGVGAALRSACTGPQPPRGRRKVVQPRGRKLHVDTSGVAHRFRVTGTEPVRFLGMVAPGGLENLYREVGAPAPDRGLPKPKPTPPETASRISRWAERGSRFRVGSCRPAPSAGGIASSRGTRPERPRPNPREPLGQALVLPAAPLVIRLLPSRTIHSKTG